MFELRLHPVSQVVAGWQINPGDRLADVFAFYREFAATEPESITSTVIFLTAPPMPGLPESLPGAPAGDYGYHQSIRTGYLPQLSGDAIATLTQHAGTAVSPQCLIELIHLEGASGDVAKATPRPTSVGHTTAGMPPGDSPTAAPTPVSSTPTSPSHQPLPPQQEHFTQIVSVLEEAIPRMVENARVAGGRAMKAPFRTFTVPNAAFTPNPSASLITPAPHGTPILIRSLGEPETAKVA